MGPPAEQMSHSHQYPADDGETREGSLGPNAVCMRPPRYHTAELGLNPEAWLLSQFFAIEPQLKRIGDTERAVMASRGGREGRYP